MKDQYVYCAVNNDNEIQEVRGSSSRTRYFRTNKHLKKAVEYHNHYSTTDDY